MPLKVSFVCGMLSATQYIDIDATITKTSANNKGFFFIYDHSFLAPTRYETHGEVPPPIAVGLWYNNSCGADTLQSTRR